MTTPRGKAANKFLRGSDGPRWKGQKENERKVIERAGSSPAERANRR